MTQSTGGALRGSQRCLKIFHPAFSFRLFSETGFTYMDGILKGKVHWDTNLSRRPQIVKTPQKGPGAETPGLFLRKIGLGNRTDYSRLFSSALLNRWITSPRKVTLIFAP